MLFASLVMTNLLGAAPSGSPAAGIWTNTEDAYFAEEEDRNQPEWAAFEIGEDGRWRPIDAFGKALGEWAEGPIPGVSRREGGGWQIATSELRQARPFTCWMSLRKPQDKPDGSADWSFQSGLRTFDQGGRIAVGGGDAPEATIRLRNVTWAKGSRNAPSLVLYIHQDDPERAVSYAWAAPDSERIGINLRWIQGSCSVDFAAMGGTDAALVKAGQDWKTLYEAGDWGALRQLYTDDAVLMTANQEKIEGADNILAFLQRLSGTGAKVEFRFEPEEAVAKPPFGFVTAKYRMDIAIPGRDPVVVAGRSFLVYKWLDGEWKLWRDIDNFAPDVTAADFED